ELVLVTEFLCVLHVSADLLNQKFQSLARSKDAGELFLHRRAESSLCALVKITFADLTRLAFMKRVLRPGNHSLKSLVKQAGRRAIPVAGCLAAGGRVMTPPQDDAICLRERW